MVFSFWQRPFQFLLSFQNKIQNVFLNSVLWEIIIPTFLIYPQLSNYRVLCNNLFKILGVFSSMSVSQDGQYNNNRASGDFIYINLCRWWCEWISYSIYLWQVDLFLRKALSPVFKGIVACCTALQILE